MAKPKDLSHKEDRVYTGKQLDVWKKNLAYWLKALVFIATSKDHGGIVVDIELGDGKILRDNFLLEVIVFLTSNGLVARPQSMTDRRSNFPDYNLSVEECVEADLNFSCLELKELHRKLATPLELEPN